jgi:peptidoglycan/xylan/chitin deacetylase (PgdA/CDA1 family)/tetratricopeptide (TPR) repeat protein
MFSVGQAQGSRPASSTPRKSLKLRLPLEVILLLALPASLLSHYAYAAPSEQCWGNRELARIEGDAAIKKGVDKAFKQPPSERPNRLPAIKREKRGAIRRVNLPQGQNFVALTFDLCEQPYEVAGYDGRIVDILREQGVRATFFAGGKWLLTHEERAKQLITDPLFEVGNHTWEHRNLRLLSGDRLRTEIEAPQAAYEQLHATLNKWACSRVNAQGGAEPAEEKIKSPASMKLFRFPFGACDRKSLDAVNDAGLLAIQWDVSSGDPSMGVSATHMTNYVLKHVQPGSIILFHANGRGWHTAEALRGIIKGLKDKGFGLKTVQELLDIPRAVPDIRPECFDEKPGDTNRYDELARRLEVKFEEFESRHQKEQQARTSRKKQEPAEIKAADEKPGDEAESNGQSEGAEGASQDGLSEAHRDNVPSPSDARAPQPDNKQGDANKVELLMRQGNAHALNGDLDKALDDFQNCKALAAHLAEAEPDNVGWLLDLAFCHEGIGNVFMTQPDFERAQEAYSSRKQIFSGLASRDPDEIRWQRELVVSHAILARLYWEKGDLVKARGALLSGKAIIENAMQSTPSVKWEEELTWFDRELPVVLTK